MGSASDCAALALVFDKSSFQRPTTLSDMKWAVLDLANQLRGYDSINFLKNGSIAGKTVLSLRVLGVVLLSCQEVPEAKLH